MQEPYCLFCEAPATLRKVKDYKEINTDLKFNLYPACDKCDSYSGKFKRPAFKRWTLARGWVRRPGRGWCRENANDWMMK